MLTKTGFGICRLYGLQCVLCLLVAVSVKAVKLKFRYEECLSYNFQLYEPFYGSFVALPDLYGVYAKYDLVITSPSNSKVYEILGQNDGKFHLIPYEAGRYKFCLRLNHDKTHSRYVLSRDVVWDLHVGHADTTDGMKEQDTQNLWHYVHTVDAQLQQLKATQQYLYWRERRHRKTVESTNKKVLMLALVRSGALVLVSLFQVFMIRRMFSK